MHRLIHPRALATVALIALPAAFAIPLPARAAGPTASDCLGAHNSATDLRSEQKLRKARAQLLVCAGATCPSDIRKDCAVRVDELSARIPTIVFAAKNAAGTDLRVVKVTMDGELLAERLDGAALAVDPGEHSFVFETPGEPPVEKRFLIRESEKGRHEQVELSTPCPAGTERQPGASACVGIAPKENRDGPHAPSGSASGSPGLGTQKVLGLVAAGLGVIGLGVGAAFGLLTLSEKSQQETDCASSASCNHPTQAANDHSSGMTDASVATAGFIAGGVLLAGGGLLYFTAHSASERPSASARLFLVPSVGPGGGGMVLRGEF